MSIGIWQIAIVVILVVLLFGRGKISSLMGDVAKGINKPKAVRAVANAIGKNPYAPKIPCHRVIRSDGSLGGYSGKGGIKTKKKLLKSEGILL